jgi:hypothetical protein
MFGTIYYAVHFEARRIVVRGLPKPWLWRS